MDKPLVSIIILNWNGTDHIFDCIKSVQQQTYPNIELIIVDNASTDDSLARIKSLYPNLIYVENSENLYFAKGMNTGFEKCTGEFIMPLNLDAYLSEEYIEKAVTIFLTEPETGAIGGTELIWQDGQFTNEVHPTTGPVYMKKWIQFRAVQDRSSQYSLGIPGSFPFIRAEALEECRSITGYYYDERYIHGWEDTDLWFRLQWAGWKIKFEPSLKAWHVKSASVEGKKTLMEKSHFHQSIIFRNRRFLINKGLSKNVLKATFIHRCLLEILFPLYLLIKHPSSVKVWFDAKKEANKIKPELESEKKAIQKHSKINKNYFIQFIK